MSLRFISILNIDSAIAHHLDHLKPEKIISSRQLKLTDEVHEYLSKHIIAVSRMSGAVPGRFYEDLWKQQGSVANACRSIFDDKSTFTKMSGEIADRLFKVMGSNRTLTPGLVIILAATNLETKEKFVAIIKMEPQPVFSEDRKQLDGQTYIDLALGQTNLIYSGKHIQKCALIKASHSEKEPEILLLDKQSRDAAVAGFFHEHFLQAEYCRDSHFRTKKFVREFVKWANRARMEHRISPEQLEQAVGAARHALRSNQLNVPKFVESITDNRGEQNDCLETMVKKNVDVKFDTEAKASEAFRKKSVIKTDHALQIRVPQSAFLDKQFYNVATDPEDATLTVITIKTRKYQVS